MLWGLCSLNGPGHFPRLALCLRDGSVLLVASPDHVVHGCESLRNGWARQVSRFLFGALGSDSSCQRVKNFYAPTVSSFQQAQFDFASERPDDGYSAWIEQRRSALRQLSRQLGLPLGRIVEVWIRGEIRLNGRLHLAEELLFLPGQSSPELVLEVDRVRFRPEEIVSCVARD